MENKEADSGALPTTSSPESLDKLRLKSLLLVDNDPMFCSYIKAELPNYNVTICESIENAWKHILNKRPDIVVVSCQMKDGDGFELCQRIKMDTETDTISVILLAGQIDESILIQSMQSNADHILVKPINTKLLDITIQQTIRAHESILNKIHRIEMAYDYTNVELENPNEKLVKKVVEFIKENLDDNNLSVERLSQQLGYSRVHLNRKLKEKLGLSPSNLIRSIRLKQAAYLLLYKKANISEVAFKVGFSSHSYFTHNFHTHFGMSPKEFMATYSENSEKEELKKLLE